MCCDGNQTLVLEEEESLDRRELLKGAAAAAIGLAVPLVAEGKLPARKPATPDASKVGPNDGRVRGWRIWYDDGNSFSSKVTEWEDLPKDGVTHFCLYFDKEHSPGKPWRRVSSGADFYFKAKGARGPIFGHTDGGQRESDKEVASRYPGAVILRGKWADEVTMYAAEKEMMAAEEF